jgi:protein-disulfide isomerase
MKGDILMQKVFGVPFFLILIMLLSSVGMSDAQLIDVDWTQLHRLELKSPPLDVASTPDGELIFILMSGKVAVYNKDFQNQLNQIPVEAGYNRMAYAADSEMLVLTNGTTRESKSLRISRVFEISVEGSPFLGPENAPVTIAVFDDYECGYCARMEAIFSQLMARYPQKLKLVIKQYPLRSHANAREAAIAAVAAHQQGKFWEVHSQIFANQKDLSPQKLDEIAENFGLDMIRFKQDLLSQDVLSLIVRDVREGQKIGVSGTPTIFINGKHVTDRSFQNLTKRIDRELAK